MKTSIVNFFLLVLRILLNIYLNTYYKCNKFSKTLLEKSFKFISNRENNIIALYLSLMLFLTEIDFVAKKQNCKRDIFMIYSSSYIKMIRILQIEVITLYI